MERLDINLITIVVSLVPSSILILYIYHRRKVADFDSILDCKGRLLPTAFELMKAQLILNLHVHMLWYLLGTQVFLLVVPYLIRCIELPLSLLSIERYRQEGFQPVVQL